MLGQKGERLLQGVVRGTTDRLGAISKIALGETQPIFSNILYFVALSQAAFTFALWRMVQECFSPLTLNKVLISRLGTMKASIIDIHPSNKT